MQNSPPAVIEISPPSSGGGSRNVDGDGDGGRDHRRRGHSLRGGADGPPGEVGGDSPPVGHRAGVDRRNRAPLGPGSQDRPTLPARHGVAAVSPPRAAGDAADAARRVSARAGGAGRLLGADPVSGAPAARLSRQLRDGQALRPAPARHALGGRARAHPVRDAARAAEPDRLGPCASAVPPIFVLTLGFSRRSYYQPCLNEALPQFLDAHERAFEYFGGHTREHLYDRPRTVCQGTAEGRILWNSTFRSFADYWGFEPRLCQPYRAQTKGKVESGVKYFRRNFLPGRTFVDDVDLDEQLRQWMTEIADQRIHGTTHERPIDRFAEEQRHLVGTAGHPSFRLEARQPRVVADDYLVSFETNRYSVPFTLIGQAVEVLRGAGRVAIFHRGTLVAEHPELPGKYQLR